MTRIYVGNLDRRSTEAALRSTFEVYGHVAGVNVVSGFALVEMSNDVEAEKAISDLDSHTTWVLRRYAQVA